MKIRYTVDRGEREIHNDENPFFVAWANRRGQDAVVIFVRVPGNKWRTYIGEVALVSEWLTGRHNKRANNPSHRKAQAEEVMRSITPGIINEFIAARVRDEEARVEVAKAKFAKEEARSARVIADLQKFIS